ncbi:MAG TPA: NAD-dependent epimerase/dehydratase family protein [Vicinamibacteria bacterium]
MPSQTDVVTGAYGYIGKYIARRLLDSGRKVRTITTHPDKENPFGDAVRAFPFHFDSPALLTENLRGARTLYNTYWVRFEYGGATFERAVENTKTLFRCARSAGIEKIVHISVTNVSTMSRLPYYRGKALQEEALVESSLPYSIVRPTLVFGKEDILVNNIAWMLRRFPLFPIFGTGEYRVQPVFVEDLASIAVTSAVEESSRTLDAIGPETFSFKELVELMASAVGRNVKFVHVSPSLGILLGRVIGWFVRDVILTRDELSGLMDSLLCSQERPNGRTKFSDWTALNAHGLGTSYSSELGRHFRWRKKESRLGA